MNLLTEGKGSLGRRIAWAAAAIAPPSVLTAVSLEWVKNHPIVAACLTIAYEAVLAVARFAGEVASDLRRRWRVRLVDRLDQRLILRLSRYHGRYRQHLLSSLRYIDVKGLATIGYYTPELDEVFVDVSLAFRAPHQVSGDPLADVPAEMTERRSIWDFLDRPQPVVLALIGAAGSGKTTLLRHTARQVCKSRDRRRNVPILLYLRDHAATIVDKPELGLTGAIRQTLGIRAADEPRGWFEQKLQQGRCLVLLDGLDEVANQEDRRCVVTWVDQQIKQYPENDYIITSRPHGYHSAPLEGANVLQVRRFTDEQVGRFVHSWYQAVERHSTSATDDGWSHRADIAAYELLQRLRNSPALYDLTVNPLLLTMIANVHRYRGALPGSRAELYAEICQVLLWRRQEAKKLLAELRGDQKEVLLRELAFTMMHRRVRDLSKEDMLPSLQSVLPRVSSNLTAEEFLSDVSSTGLLIERENGVYAFAHQTFQEYLAATHIREKGKTNVLTESVGDPWWREVALLYVARADGGPVVQACLTRGSAGALALAFECADQASELAPQLRSHLDSLLADADDPSIDPERRRLMAGVTVTRHLRDLTRVANGAHLCRRPIPLGIYRHFLHDMQARGENRSLDSPDIDTDAIDQVAVGMRGSDAVAFVNWLNELTRAEPIVRLPYREEIEDIAQRRMPDTLDHDIWVLPSSERRHPELWLGSKTDHPHSIAEQTVCHHLRIDIQRASLLVTLLVIRTRILLRALDRALALDRDRHRTLSLIRDRGRELASTLNQTLIHTCSSPAAIALALDHALDQNLDIALDQDLDVAVNFALPRDLGLARDRAQSRARDLDRALGRALDRGRALYREINLDSRLALDHACNLALDLDLALARDDALDRALNLEHDYSTAVGTTLSGAISGSLIKARTRRDLGSTILAEFSDYLVEKSGIKAVAHIVSFDNLASQLTTAVELLRKRHNGSATSKNCWPVEVANRLEAIAIPIFGRQEALAPEIATAIRLGTVCLACENEDAFRDETSLMPTFQMIAAGITLLERRITGQTAATETILVALA